MAGETKILRHRVNSFLLIHVAVFFFRLFVAKYCPLIIILKYIRRTSTIVQYEKLLAMNFYFKMSELF